MLSKEFLTKTRIIALLILSVFSFIAVSSVYLAISIGMEKKFGAYKKEYFTEQAHNMSYFVSEKIDGTLKVSEHDKMFARLSKEYSIPYL